MASLVGFLNGTLKVVTNQEVVGFLCGILAGLGLLGAVTTGALAENTDETEVRGNCAVRTITDNKVWWSSAPTEVMVERYCDDHPSRKASQR